MSCLHKGFFLYTFLNLDCQEFSGFYYKIIRKKRGKEQEEKKTTILTKFSYLLNLNYLIRNLIF